MAKMLPPHRPEHGIDPLRYVVQVNRIAAIVGLVFFTGAVALCWWMFSPFVPPAIMHAWLWFSGLFLAIWLMLAVTFVVRRPDDSERVRLWSPIAVFIRITSNLVVLATIWLFLPHAPRDLQLVMTVFYVAHAATQLLAMPERGLINATGTAIVLGSIAMFHVVFGGAYSTSMAIFISAFGAVIVVLGMVEGRLIGNVMAERRRSDETTLRLEVALSAIAEERDAKTRFIAAASHDLGQPLQAGNLFFSQLLRAKDEKARSIAADGVRRAFESADQLLSHMLGFLRLESDAVAPQCTLVPVSSSIDRMVAQFRPAADRAGLSIRSVSTSIIVLTDRTLLERALGNLLDNAIRHSGASRVLVGARLYETSAILWIIDDGSGISADAAERVFEDYFTGEPSRMQASSGFGLGLASVRRIAELLGGAAGLDPRWTKGAAFYVRLPRLHGSSNRQIARHKGE